MTEKYAGHRLEENEVGPTVSHRCIDCGRSSFTKEKFNEYDCVGDGGEEDNGGVPDSIVETFVEDGGLNTGALKGTCLNFVRESDEIVISEKVLGMEDDSDPKVEEITSEWHSWMCNEIGNEWLVFYNKVDGIRPTMENVVEWMVHNNDEFVDHLDNKLDFPGETSGSSDDDKKRSPGNLKEWGEREGTTTSTNERTNGSRGLDKFEGTETIVIDLYCSAGGVGHALDSLGIKHVGVDIEDYSDTYPGKFVQGDASDIEWLETVFSQVLDEYYVVVWLSPPCKAYTKANNEIVEERKKRFPTFDDLNVYEVAERLGDEYIIENVTSCDDFRGDVTRLNGWAFNEDYCWERHFDTSFRCPDRKTKQGNNGYIALSGSTGEDCVGENELARAKGVPEDWGKYEIRSAIPPVYVQYLLSYCPRVSVDRPVTHDDTDPNNISSWAKTHGTTDSVDRPEKNVPVNQILQGNSKERLLDIPGKSVDMAITSPPYWNVRDYDVDDVELGDGWDGQLGQEPTPDMFVDHLVDIFDRVERVLKDSGSLWVNIDDTYAHGNGARVNGGRISRKSLCGVPERFMLEMIDRGWVLRNKVLWVKQYIDVDGDKEGVSLPTAAQDRIIENACEPLYHFTKEPNYFYELDNISVEHSQATIEAAEKGGKPSESYIDEGVYGANALNPENIREGGANIPNVWLIQTAREENEHFAPFPEELCRRPIQASCPEDGVVLDPFAGTGTALKVASELGRDYIGIELSEKYIEYAKRKIGGKVIT